MNNILAIQIDPRQLNLDRDYREWLTEWLHNTDKSIEAGDVAVSTCYQACLSEIALFGTPQRDWQGILERYLKTDEGLPLAYSEKFSKRLYKFTAQWKQVPVHAIYTHFWFSRLVDDNQNLSMYVDLIESYIQPNGWIYNPKVSVTQIRTRMKSELFMSMAMGLEILVEADRLAPLKKYLTSTLSSIGMTGYLSAEYFRAFALEKLGSASLIPTGMAEMIVDCEAGEGFSDFAVKNKVDDYMGTAKRTSRDIALHSPLSTLHALYLSQYLLPDQSQVVHQKVKAFAHHLDHEPFDIPAFRIRDLVTPFGTDLSPIEIISSSWLRTKHTD